MLSNVFSSTVFGLDAYIVDVEIDISRGLPLFSLVGLPDTAVKESKDRVKSAIKNTGFKLSSNKIVINLAPADIKKEGSAFDLPIAIGILTAEGIVDKKRAEDYVMVGELSLDGRIKEIKGALSIAVSVKESNIKGLILPVSNAKEAAVVSGIDVYGVETLPQVVEFINGNLPQLRPTDVEINTLFSENSTYQDDFIEVKGQEHAKRALEIAASGAHNILMIGPPGSGKTMLSKRLCTILPPMNFEEAIETTKIHSIMGLLPQDSSLLIIRPFRSPHHTISDAGLIGGGQIPKPGEVSLANNGVLFLDELPEFKRNVLEVLRQPLEDGSVTISRVTTSITYPSRFMMVSAMNPCNCGYFTDQTHECICTPMQIEKYRSRVSGPLLDRIDIHIDVPAVSFKDLHQDNNGEDSKTIRERVCRARSIQEKRYRDEGIYCNSQLRPRQLKRHCNIDDECKRLIEMAMSKLGLSARAYNKILKVSRTIADLDGRKDILSQDISEAIQYRSLDRRIFV